MKKIQNIPVAIMVSRETGQVIETSRAEVLAEDFKKICQELMKSGEERKEAEE